MIRTLPALALLLSLPATARAETFTFTITNHGTETWSDGVAALLDASQSPDALLTVGDAPRNGETYDTYTYGHATCDPSGEDDGDATLLIDRWGLVEGVNGYVVPSLAPGASVDVTIDAMPGEVLSFVARVEGSDDDVVMMHALGDTSDTTIDLFNDVGLPLFNVRFDIAGYDLASTDPADGELGADCARTCAPSANGCYVALGNGTVGADAGGDQVLPPEPDFKVFPGYALTPEPGTFYESGVGAPTVLYRKRSGTWVMFFETKLPQTSPDCPVGMWGLGVATSDDGWNWTVRPDPILEPTPGTYYSCVVAHPTAVIENNGGHIDLWFKAEQGNDACPEGAAPPSWGCDRYTGVGYARVKQQLNSLLTLSATPVLQQGQVFGFPSVTKVNGTYHMLVQTYPSFYHASATSPAGPWTLDPDPVVEPGFSNWALTEVYNPALVCEGDVTVPPFPYRLWFGGRSRSTPYGPILDGGISDAISTDAASWFFGIVPVTFSGDAAFRHWDALRVGDDYLLYYSERVDGKNHVGLAATADLWDPSEIATRICPQPNWW